MGRIITVTGEIEAEKAGLVLVHAQNEPDVEALANLARLGAWIELDGIGANADEGHESHCLGLIEAGCGGKILLSHDAGWYRVGEKGGGAQRPFTLLFESFLPRLRAKGVADDLIRRITVDNPAEAFSIL